VSNEMENPSISPVDDECENIVGSLQKAVRASDESSKKGAKGD